MSPLARWIVTAVAAGGLVTGGLLIKPAVTPVSLPTAAELLRLAGPARGLPVPFLWRDLGSALRDNDTARLLGLASWITTLQPERDDLFVAFSFKLAYDAADLESSPRARARRLFDAIALLDEGASLHPSSWELPAYAGFHLEQRCSGSRAAEATARAFEALTGHAPLRLAAAYLKSARHLAPRVDWLRWHEALTAQLRAVAAVERGATGRAGRLFLEAAAKLRPDNARRAARLERLGRLLGSGAARLPADLVRWLSSDYVLGRRLTTWRSFARQAK